MATYIKTILPSGHGLWLEKLSTRQYRAVVERVTSKLGESSTAASISTRLASEMLLAALRGVTHAVVPVVMNEVGDDLDVDKMLESLQESDWVRPTYENLITEGPLNINELLSDPGDYMVAEGLVHDETMGGRASALKGKVKREYGAQ